MSIFKSSVEVLCRLLCLLDGASIVEQHVRCQQENVMKNNRLGVRLEPLLLELATIQARKEGIHMSQLIRQALLTYLSARA
jgi:predicted HicB family RNase H-like nuclease